MAYNKIEIRTLSMLGQRGAFGTALTELARSDNRIMALTADLGNTSGLDRFRRDFPERFINVGIAEQNLLGVSAGLADAGYIPFATTFANFAAMRACEFVRHFMGYMNCNIKLVGLSAGYGMELFGNTHYGVEDVAAIRSIPNITIFSPADGLEVAKCVKAAVDIDGPVYLRLTGVMNSPIIYKKDFEFIPGKAVIHRKGKDVVLIGTGTVMKNVLAASEKLDNEEIHVSVVEVNTIKPLDMEILEQFKDFKYVFTVEEHSRNGGLGTSVAEFFAEQGYKSSVIRLGTGDVYTKAGSYSYKIKEMGLDADSIAAKVHSLLNI